MEVLVSGSGGGGGSCAAFTIEVSPPPSPPKHDKTHHHHDHDHRVLGLISSSGRCVSPEEKSSVEDPSDTSSSSSSIGAPDDSGDEEEDGVVSSKEGLGSLDSLEESLPIKRGLSNYFSGKSKSFANLTEMSREDSNVSLKDIEKQDNPFNKRRRILMANKLSRKSFYTWSNPNSMPLLALRQVREDEDDDYVYDDNEENPSSSSSTSTSSTTRFESKPHQCGVFGSKHSGCCDGFRVGCANNLRSQSCFSLADLHEDVDYINQ